MVVLSAENLTKTYADRVLFEALTFSLYDNDRVGLIGVNGSGKSTLLRVLSGVEPPDEGRITVGNDRKVTYLPQNPLFDPDMTVLDYLFATPTEAMQRLREYERLSARVAQKPGSVALREQLHRLTEEMERLGAWEAEVQARTVLSRVGITALDATLGELSGGERKRVALAAALLDDADLLILDEPTNHLDVDTVAWLETYLAQSARALLLVTHDRYFLDRTVNRIFELDNGHLYTYDGNYRNFVGARAERERVAVATTLKRQNLLRKEMAWLQRGARARSTKQKAHIKRIETLAARIEQAPDPQGEVTIALGSRRLGKRVIEINSLSKAWDGETVIRDFTYTVEPGARIGIVGPNGAGKTTFLNILSGYTSPDSGDVTPGETVHLAYFDQESHELPREQRVLDYIQEQASLIRLPDGRSVTASAMLEWFLFPREQQYSLIDKLSGGEKRRLYLLRTLMDRPNVLLLDEPTNDLDIQTLTVLEDFLDSFSGTVIAVSHDRYFLDRVVDFILAFEADGTIREYPGNYSLYQEMRRDEERKGKALEPERRAPSHPKPRESERKLSWNERRELEEIDQQMATLEERLSEIEDEMVAAGSDFEALARLQEEKEALEVELEKVMERWLTLKEIESGT